MSEYVTLIVERRWTHDDTGDEHSYTDAETEFRSEQLDALSDDALVATVRRLIERTVVEDG